MHIRNPKYNSHGCIDCEIEHATFGWIPFTANGDDIIGESIDIFNRIINGEAGPIEPYVPTIVELKSFSQSLSEKITEVDKLAKVKRDFIVQHYSAAEMASWPIKREEALAWLSNPNYDLIQQLAPGLNIEATYRQMNINDLVNKVISKANQFIMLESAIAGYTGYLQDQLRAVQNEDINALNNIDINIGWPI